MISLTWIGFFIGIAVLMILARKSLWIGLLVAAVILGIFSISPSQMGEQVLITLSDPSILLLALAVGIISMIGGAMEVSSLIDDLVANLRLKKRNFLAFSPGLFGCLPMPGGALLSAPLVDKGGKGVPAPNKTAINVWFRHVLLIVYPLGALLATTKIARLDLFVAILYLVPGFILVLVLGYVFLLRDVKGENTYGDRFNAYKLAVPLFIILTAPLLDLVLIQLFPHIIPEIPLVIAVTVSLLLAFHFGGLGVGDVRRVAQKMKSWNFVLIIIAMFIFLNVFTTSPAPSLIAELPVSKAVLIVGIGALLGFATGRVQVPVSIIVPIYFSKYGVSAMSPPIFAITYFSIFMGYIISPVHPCVSVSLEYFSSSLKSFFRIVIVPTIIALLIVFGLAMVIL